MYPKKGTEVCVRGSAGHQTLWPHRQRCLPSLALISGLLLSHSISAQTTDPTDFPADFSEQDLFTDIPEVISATRLSQRLTEAPASITIIDRNTIEASGATRIPDLFRLVPGMQVYHVTRNQSAVTYHALSDNFPNRLEVMIDGRSIYLPLLSTVAWETIGIELDDIDYIEVVRGSNVPSQGSNAFLGSINIVTRTALDHSPNSVKIMRGNRDDRRAEWRHSWIGDAGQMRISAGSKSNAGSPLFEEGAEHHYLHLNGSTTLSLQDTIDLQLGFARGETEILDADFAHSKAYPRDHDANYQHLVWNHASDNENEFRLAFTHNYLDLNVDAIPAEEWLSNRQEIDIASATALAQLVGVDGSFLRPDSEHGKTEQYDLELQHTYFASESLHLISGLGYTFERATSDVLLDTTDWINEERARLFANVQWNQTNNLIWNVGAMYEDTSVAGHRLSPRLAVNYLLDQNSSIRAARTRAYRMPSLLERHNTYNLRQNDANNNRILEQQASAAEGLKPEEINSTELGFYRLWPELHLQLDSRLYREKVSNGIRSVFIPVDPDLVIDDPVLATVENGTRISKGNAEFFTSDGIEFQVKYQPHTETQWLLNYGFQEISGQYLKKPNDTLYLHHYVPRHTASMLFSQTLADRWQFSLAHYMMSSTRWLEGTSSDKERKAYQRTDLQIRKQFSLTPGTDLELKLIVQNLLDKRYQEFYANNHFDRRAFVELKLLY